MQALLHLRKEGEQKAGIRNTSAQLTLLTLARKPLVCLNHRHPAVSAMGALLAGWAALSAWQLTVSEAQAEVS